LPSEQVDSLIQYMCNTLPQKIFTGWQEQQKPGRDSIAIDTSSKTVPLIWHSPRPQSEQYTHPDESSGSTSHHSAQKVMSLISESVAETYREWLGNAREDIHSMTARGRVAKMNKGKRVHVCEIPGCDKVSTTNASELSS
jgi:hypothetical protein